ncbi:MAG TPA: hypothetical protein VGP08_24690 [Pyrinomonadaceae bacterium]|jgi:hypothetical protein|nr:hypothetical protein [Pyrinomonadaceae bacterium]
MTKNGKNLARRATNLLVLFALILGTVVPSFAAMQRRRTRRRAPVTRRVTTPPVRYFTVPADTIIRVRMDTELNSKTARTGDRFSATVTEPVYGGGSGVDVVPTGSKVWGRVTTVRRAGRRTPGNISVSFYQVELPNGARHTINGSLSALQADDVNSDNEGTVSGKGNRNRDAVFIGGGAATGAIIGAIAGGGKGAAIGAILGGGLGTGARVYEKEQDAEVKSGTQFGVILNRAVSLPEYRRQ